MSLQASENNMTEVGTGWFRRPSRAALAMLAFCLAGNLHAMNLREALGHFESGATQRASGAADRMIGSRQEVSRFQILPKVWRQYTRSRNYTNPDVAWTVAERILRDREQWFKRATGREWDDVDLYLMWNAPGAYAKANWDRAKLSRVVLNRAQRFANLRQVENERIMVRARAD